MKCSNCGYEGEGFPIVGGSPPCCNAWTPRQCPKCGHIDRYCEIEERKKTEEKIKRLCKEIKEALEKKDFEKAFKLRQEAEELNECIGLKEEGEFLASLAKQAREWKKNKGKVLLEQ